LNGSSAPDLKANKHGRKDPKEADEALGLGWEPNFQQNHL
jgi:hypothetical protein